MTNNLPETLSQYQIELVCKKLNHIDSAYIPAKNSAPFQLLALLVLNNHVEKDDAIMVLKDDPRSPLQRLREKDFGFWCIHNLNKGKSVKALYQLDQRHLSGCLDDDLQARLDAKLKYTQRSVKLAHSGLERLPKALIELQECQTGQLNLRI